MKVESKLPNVGVTIFTVMSRLAAEHRAVNLSQGFPDFNTHPQLIERVAHYMKNGYNQYAPMQGILPLREKIAQKIQDLYGGSYCPESEITVTSGATEALFSAISAIVRPGDEVIIFEPAFDSYAPAVELNQGKPVFIELKYPDYSIDWEDVKSLITPKTRLMIFNSPHNPTGTVLMPSDIEQLVALIKNTDIFLISDEVYEHIIFDDIPHESFSKYSELAERSFVIGSYGKTYHTTGWKIGFCLAPKEMTKELQRIHQYVTFASNTPIQFAFADAMSDKKLYGDLPLFYQRKRDLFLSMTKNSKFKPLACSGTYFLMMDYSAITDLSDTEFSKKMIVDYGVAAIPPSVFYSQNIDHKVLRFCFAKKDETLEKAAEILCRI